VQALLAAAKLPGDAEILGPLPVNSSQREPDAIRSLVRVPRSEGAELAAALHAGQAVRSAAKDPGAVRVQLDPAALI